MKKNARLEREVGGGFGVDGSIKSLSPRTSDNRVEVVADVDAEEIRREQERGDKNAHPGEDPEC